MQSRTTDGQTQQDGGSTTEKLVEKKKRGRPPGLANKLKAHTSEKYPAIDPQTLVSIYVDFLSKHPASPEPSEYSLGLFLGRIDQLTANIIDNKPLAQRIAELTGMPLRLVEKVVIGAIPPPIQLVVVLAEKLEVETDYLLMGNKPHRTSPVQISDIDAGERQMLDYYRSGDEAYKAFLMFMLALPRLLILWHPEARARVIASLVHLHDAGAQECLSILPSVLGTFKVKTGIDPSDFFGCSTVFTPVHEKLGIYGPEQVPLVQYMLIQKP